MPSIKKSYIGSTLGSTNTPLDEVEVTPPDVPTPRAHYDETSITYGTGTVSGRWDNIGWETDTIWHISDANNVNDPGQAVINGINAVVTEISRIRTPMNTTTIAQEWNVFFVIEPSADVTTGQGIADARSLRTGALQLYILNEEMIFAVEDGPGDLRLEARPEAQVVWMRCMGQAGDSTFQVTTAVDVRSVSGPLDDVVHAWIRIFNGLGAPIGQAHYPGKIGEIVLHETLTVDQGQAVVNSLANKWLNEVPLWSDVPDATVNAGIEYNINMNLWVDGRGEILFNWVLNGGVTGVTIDQNGVITIETNVLPQTLSLSVTVENIHGASTSNTFDWVLDLDISPPAPTWIQQPEDQLTNENDLPGTYDVSELVFSFVPLTWAVTAPATIDTNGVISINTAVGVYPLTVTATNETGSTDSDEFDWTIEEGGDPPEWDTVPDNYIHADDLPTTVDMNQWVTGDNLTGWQLSGAPTGVTIDNAGIVSVAVIDPQRATMTCYVENAAGGDTSNQFTWLVADDADITSQPVDTTVIEPQDGSFTIVVEHSDPEADIHLLWQSHTGDDIWTHIGNVFVGASGPRQPTVTLPTEGMEGVWPVRCRVRSYIDTDDFEIYSTVVSITVDRVPPVIDTHPSDTTVTEPNGTTFSVEASHPAGAPLFPVWQAHDGGGVWGPAGDTLNTDPASETTFNLVITDTEFDQTGSNVRCAVRAYQANNDQRVNSNSAVLTINSGAAPPVWDPIPNQSDDDVDLPQSLDMDSYCTGADSYTNAGAGDLVGSILTIPRGSNPNEYTCQVIANNIDGSASSNTFTWTVIGTPPIISVQPTDLEITVPNGATNTVVASHPVEGVPISYQWQGDRGDDNWTWLQNILSDVNLAAQATVHINSTNSDDAELSPIPGRVVVMSYVNDPESPLATISDEYTIDISADQTVIEIDVQPEDREVEVPNGTTFSVEASASDEGITLLYKWEAWDPEEEEWTHPANMLSDVDFDSVVTDTLIIKSTSLDEEPDSPPIIIVEPADQVIQAPNGVTFHVEVTSSSPETYYWEANTGSGWGDAETVLSNATQGNSNTLRLLSSVEADTGNVRCTITNDIGSVQTRDAGLTVQEDTGTPIIFMTDFSLDTGWHSDQTGSGTWPTTGLLTGFDSNSRTAYRDGEVSRMLDVVPNTVDDSGGNMLRVMMTDYGVGREQAWSLTKHLTGTMYEGYKKLYVRYRIAYPREMSFFSRGNWKWNRCYANSGGRFEVWGTNTWSENRPDSAYLYWGVIHSNGMGCTTKTNDQSIFGLGSAGGRTMSSNWGVETNALPFAQQPGNFQHMGAQAEGTDGIWKLDSQKREEFGWFEDQDAATDGWHTVEFEMHLSDVPEQDETNNAFVALYFDGLEQLPITHQHDRNNDNSKLPGPSKVVTHAYESAGWNFWEVNSSFREVHTDWSYKKDGTYEEFSGHILFKDVVISTERIGHDFEAGYLDNIGNRANAINPLPPRINTMPIPTMWEDPNWDGDGSQYNNHPISVISPVPIPPENYLWEIEFDDDPGTWHRWQDVLDIRSADIDYALSQTVVLRFFNRPGTARCTVTPPGYDPIVSPTWRIEVDPDA